MDSFKVDTTCCLFLEDFKKLVMPPLQAEPLPSLCDGRMEALDDPLVPAGLLPCLAQGRAMTQLGQGDPQELPSSHHTGLVEALPAGGVLTSFLKSS